MAPLKKQYTAWIIKLYVAINLHPAAVLMTLVSGCSVHVHLGWFPVNYFLKKCLCHSVDYNRVNLCIVGIPM